MKRLRESRKRLKLTMKELGAMVGVTEAAISHYELGKRQPDYDLVVKLSDCLGVTVDYLLGREESKSDVQNESSQNENSESFGADITDVSNYLCDVIIQRIQDRGIEESQCAVACGLSSDFFTDWKAGRIRNPNFFCVFAICKYLGIDINSLNIEHPVPLYASPSASSEKHVENVDSDEMRLLEQYRALDNDGKEEVRHTLRVEHRRVLAEKGMGNAKIG